ncbi:MAG: hypothetical protein IJS08_01670 [Victivallales bacterium]|nr:hypothetical protein [Victivallales bacterium]
MIKHIHQGFLLQCGYKSVILAELSVPWSEVGWYPQWQEPRELLDGDGPLIRKLLLSKLVRGPSSQEEWDELMVRLQGITTIILVDDRPAWKNPIVTRYEDATLKAFVFRLQKAGIVCRVTQKAS